MMRYVVRVLLLAIVIPYLYIVISGLTIIATNFLSWPESPDTILLLAQAVAVMVIVPVSYVVIMGIDSSPELFSLALRTGAYSTGVIGFVAGWVVWEVLWPQNGLSILGGALLGSLGTLLGALGGVLYWWYRTKRGQ